MDTISIEEVFLSIRELLSKDKANYTSTDEFNRRSERAEKLLWNFYAKHFDEHAAIPDGMIPFHATALQILDANAQFSLPTDFGRRLIARYRKATTVPGGEPATSDTRMQFLEKEEELLTEDSVIRGPSTAKNRLYYTISNGKMQVFPRSLTGRVYFEYLRLPVYGVRGYTVDVTSKEEDPDPGTTTDYQWPVKERGNLEDLILLQYGIIMKQTDILTWATSQIGDARNIQKL